MKTPTFVDVPASYHNGACGYGFADGHSEIHKWLADRTKAPVRFVDYSRVGGPAGADPRDWRWVSERTTENPSLY